MKCVTYSSYAAAGLQPAELEAILKVSGHNHARDALTGVLMFNGAIFVQSVEGPKASVDRLMARLADDPRHCQIDIHDDRSIPKRIFADWTMGYVKLDGGWLEGQVDVIEALSQDMPKRVREILHSLATTLPFA